MSKKPSRIDPAACGCTDCITGYSIPLDRATPKQLKALMAGKRYDDATGIDWGEVRARMRRAADAELATFLRERTEASYRNWC